MPRAATLVATSTLTCGLPELGQGPGALRLGLAAVQRGGPDAAVEQVLGQPVDARAWCPGT